MKTTACLIIGKYNALIYSGFVSSLVVAAAICAMLAIYVHLKECSAKFDACFQMNCILHLQV